MPHYPWFTRRDLDGFFGLFIDNLVQLLLIAALGAAVCGFSGDDAFYLSRHILPGAAVSILLGNLFYAWQARRLALTSGRNDVTALPYGINTPSLLVYVFFVMAPVYERTHDARLAWQMGLVACLGSGLIEFLGAFVAEPIRRATPRAALLSTLAGIAVGFIAMKFALEIYARPLVAMLPFAVILVTYFAGTRFPLGLPGGLLAVILGTVSAWILPPILGPAFAGPSMSLQAVGAAWGERGWFPPAYSGQVLIEALREPARWLGYLSVIVPMGLFNLIGSLQNIESAEAAGDPYPTAPSLAVNGLGTIAAAFFGSCFPTTIYIGHPGWKGLGARAGYSTLNGLAITLICLTGTVSVIRSLIPLEAGIAIVLWIGIVITAQSFQATPAAHAPAVATGLFPAIAAWGATVMQGALLAGGGATLGKLLENRGAEVNGFLVHGLVLMERGYIFTCMVLSAICAHLIDRQFGRAAFWAVVGALFAGLGLTHAYQVVGPNVDYLLVHQRPVDEAVVYRAAPIAVGYLQFALVFLLCWRLDRGASGVCSP